MQKAKIVLETGAKNYRYNKKFKVTLFCFLY